MRIISGEYRRRQLHTPPDASVTRPIPDRVKESVFMILRGHTLGATVLDCFAGCGAIGLEAISRGASRCVFVEQDKRVAALIKKNIETLGCEDRCVVVQGDALGAAVLARVPRPLKLAFFDPPYPLIRTPLGYARIIEQMRGVISLLAPDGYAVLRTPWPMQIEHPPEASDGAVGEKHIHATHKPKNPRAQERRELRRSIEHVGEVLPSDVPRSMRPGRGVRGKDEAGDDLGGPENIGGERERLLGAAMRKALRDAQGPRGLGPAESDDAALPEDLDELADELGDAKGWLAAQFDGEDGDDAAQGDAAWDVEEDGAGASKREGAAGVPGAVLSTPDLRIPGALGPETHAYGSMAVHLYMRDTQHAKA